jgi:CelD/BcsL family acetyltransferase involved in cellulose biosynthesis
VYNVDIYESPDVFPSLRSEWNALLKQSASDTPFLTHEFQSAWWAHFGTPDALRLLTARDGAGTLRGIAPLYIEGDANGQATMRLLGGVEVADYLDLIVPRGIEPDVYRAFFEALCARTDWARLDLHNLPEASPARPLFAALAAERGMRATEQVEEVCPVVALPETYDDYLNALDKKQRHELRRKMRKAYAEAQVTWYMAGERLALDEATAAFIELHQKSQQEKHAFMTAPMQAFFRDLARAMHAAGWLELSFIEVNGQRAATYFSFSYNNQTLLYNSGYDPQAYAALSPGIVLLAHLIQEAIAQRHAQFDFLQGNETYKYRMGAQDTRVHLLSISR